ncbi:bifunctional acetate--CoA ligase family protein/GNAT family N-acetyltransferase [Fodinicurvata sp. EGI_FJ10296]|uniref:bifunctional acetate--CoA ligase family protein/GNAT family N-acetyltransferase n=1 Tax=Fodinicurvata sp. EGI_FJ10296 TaxID=3231908 RepID=UPI003451A53C
MTVRNLDSLFKPNSVAVIGASRKARSVGQVVARNLLNSGFGGPVMPVNPREASIESTLSYKSVADLPTVPDLAVIVTPPAAVPGLIEELGARGTRGAVVLTAGFGEGGSDEHQAIGRDLRQRMLDAARPNLLRIVGPNCLGIMVPGIGLNASFVHIPPLAGDLAFVTQSGAVATSVVDWATHRGIGFSHVVTLGDMTDVDFGDMLDYLAADPGVRAILMYVESITDARKFMSAGRSAARTKPVVVIKSGRNAAAAKAAASHTGALAGADRVYDAAFRRAGMLRVFDMTELFDAVETLASGLKVTGDRLAIVTNGGGIGVLATESLVDGGGQVAELAPETMERLHAVLPPTWSHGNPVDIIGDAPGSRYADALETVLADPNKDGVLVLNCPTAVADSLEAAQAVVDTIARYKATERNRPLPPVVTSWLGEGAAADARKLFARHRIPTYQTPGQAARAFMHLVRYRRNQDLLMETPDALPADRTPPRTHEARALLTSALEAGREWLSEPEAKAVLSAYDIPVVRTVRVATPAEAEAAASGLKAPLAVKIVSDDITHKSDIGGVRLNLQTAEAVGEAAETMSRTIARLRPEARLSGFAVQEMAEMAGAHELILGITGDVLFGPVILFGQGGTAVEVLNDTAVALPPLNTVLARELMSRTRVWNLLQGYRSHPAADLDALAQVLVKLSRLAADLSEVAELDINPLLADDSGVLALDARIRVQARVDPGARRLAIRPYPSDLETDIGSRAGQEFRMRPIRPEDEPLIQDMLAHSAPEDIRLRFFSPLKQLTHQMAARLTQIDYDREMAFVATAAPDDLSDVSGAEAIYGVVRISADPDNENAEYGIMVRSDLKGQGLGTVLMQEIIDYARGRGIKSIHGDVLRENTSMLAMAAEMGFTRRQDADDPGVVRVEIDLAR